MFVLVLSPSWAGDTEHRPWFQLAKSPTQPTDTSCKSHRHWGLISKVKMQMVKRNTFLNPEMF